jgi:hypothetical protein
LSAAGTDVLDELGEVLATAAEVHALAGRLTWPTGWKAAIAVFE